MVFIIGFKKEIEKRGNFKLETCQKCQQKFEDDEAVIVQYWLGSNHPEYMAVHAECLINQICEKDSKFFQKMIAHKI